MIDQDQETRENNRRQYQEDSQRNERMKDPYTYKNYYGDTKEIPLEDIEKCFNDKNFQKMMEILLHDEKEKYFLKLTQEGAKLPQHHNVEKIITKEEEYETSKLQ